MPKVMLTGQWEGPVHLLAPRGRAGSRELGYVCTLPMVLPGIPASLSRMPLGSFSLPSRDLKPTNILLGDEGQPVLMDLGSMNQACIQVEGSRQALALQVRESPGSFGHFPPIPNSF